MKDSSDEKVRCVEPFFSLHDMKGVSTQHDDEVTSFQDSRRVKMSIVLHTFGCLPAAHSSRLGPLECCEFGAQCVVLCLISSQGYGSGK